MESRPSAAVVPEAELRRRERENVLGALEQAHWKVYGRCCRDVHSEMIEIVPIMVQMPRTFVNQNRAFPRVAAGRVRLRPGYLPRPKSRRAGDAEWVGSGPRCSYRKIKLCYGCCGTARVYGRILLARA